MEDDVSGGADATQTEASKHSGVALVIADMLLDFLQAQSSQFQIVILVAEIRVVEDGLSDGVGARAFVRVVRFPVEGVQRLLHVIDGTVRSVVGQSTLLLQLLPDGPDLVHERVVHEEDGVVGGVVQRGHGVFLSPSDQEVHGVVGHLELNLNEHVIKCSQFLSEHRLT